MSSPWGKRILPWRSPIQYPSRGLRSEDIGFPTPGAYTILNGSSTDTANYALVASATAGTAPRIAAASSFLQISVALHVKHSVADAKFSLAASIFNDAAGSTNIGTWYFLNLAAPHTAGDYILMTPTFWFDCSFVGALAGQHAIAFYAKPVTAGTLTWADTGSAGDHWGWLVVNAA